MTKTIMENRTQQATNEAAIRRYHDAVNAGDLELISKTIHEVVERVWHQQTGPKVHLTTGKPTRQR